MPDLKLYEIERDGFTFTVQLDEAEAKRLGAKPKSKPQPVVEEKAREVQNKARKTSTKKG